MASSTTPRSHFSRQNSLVEFELGAFDDVNIDDRFGFFTSTPTNPLLSNVALRRLFDRVRSVGSNIRNSPTSDRRSDKISLVTKNAISSSMRSNNSQGYQYFYSHELARRSVLNRLYTTLTSVPRNITLAWSGGDSSVEVPRATGAADDALDLSELFNATRSNSSPLHSPPRQGRMSMESSGEGQPQPDLFRSERMHKCQIITVRESAYHAVGEVGKLGMCQFEDGNADVSLFQRHFIRDIRKCDTMENSLRFLEEQVSKASPPIPLVPIDARHFEVPSHSEMNEVMNSALEIERRVHELNASDERMRLTLHRMVEVKHVIDKTEEFFALHAEVDAMKEIEAAEQDLLDAPGSPTLSGVFPFEKSVTSFAGMSRVSSEDESVQLMDSTADALKEYHALHSPWFVTGVIAVEKKLSFERVLWRACRRTAFVRIAEIEDDFVDPLTGVSTRKCVFIVFFKGDSLRKIVDNVCMGYNARQYEIPRTTAERNELRDNTQNQLGDLTMVILNTQDHRHQLLRSTSEKLSSWLKMVHVQKAIFHTLNRFTVDTNGFLAAECWIPACEIENVRMALENGVKQSGNEVQAILNIVETKQVPPTYNPGSVFTEVYQAIVDSYGVATYQEINPAPHMIITFPFLFAVMFGDIFHGAIMVMAAWTMIVVAPRMSPSFLKGEIVNTFFNGRFVILMMGIFSMYTGLIYNDGFGKAFNVLGSGWKSPFNQYEEWNKTITGLGRMPSVMLDPKESYDYYNRYWFGLDPVWNIADNRLSFINSMKMKASVILGIAQMTFGIMLSFYNHRFFRSSIDIWTNFVPQIIFITSIFTYLCIQIIVKWIFFSVNPGTVLGYDYPGPYCAPSLLIGFINMFMMRSRQAGYTKDGATIHDCYLAQWYPYQEKVELSLLIVALICIPIMLIGKPLHVYMQRRKDKDNRNRNARHEEEMLMTGLNGNGDEKKEEKEGADDDHGDFTDVVVHQAIHTIEFVLGCVSHTASYLRLWALSLAHAQLSEVLWHMVLMNGLNASSSLFWGPVATFVAFFIFGILTLTILILMEGMSAFLHALRLHWVEFQSKFYMGGGYAFAPLSLYQTLEKAQLLSEVQGEPPSHSSHSIPRGTSHSELPTL